MFRALYSSASGMLVQMLHQQVLSENLANVNTIGYKKDAFQQRAWPETAVQGDFASVLDGVLPVGEATATIGRMGSGVLADPVVPDLGQGQIRQTNQDFDVALVGPGMLEVQGDNGQLWYTRAGSLSRGPDGTLLTTDGRAVLGQSGPIKLPIGKLTVDSDGTLFVNGTPVDRLKIVDVPAQAGLRKIGQNALVAQDQSVAATPATTTIVQQRALESSNVNLTNEMVDMMAVMRSYETNQRMLQMQDQILGQSANDVGRVG